MRFFAETPIQLLDVAGFHPQESQRPGRPDTALDERAPDHVENGRWKMRTAGRPVVN
jgi:hypothetical protein